MQLNEVSKYMMDKIKKQNCVAQIHMNKTLKEVFHHFYNEIQSADQLFFSQKLLEKTNYTIQSIKEIPVPSSLHIPENIWFQIKKKSKTLATFQTNLSGRSVEILFILEEGDRKVKENIFIFLKYVEQILLWFLVLFKYGYSECASNGMRVLLYFSPFMKLLPEKTQEYIDAVHVNTAYTSTCPKDSEIVIYRKEDWFKTLIHETFHNFALDFSSMDVTNVHKQILGAFQVESDVNLFEAYTEFWASIIHVFFCAFDKKQDVNEFMTKSLFLLNMERKYSMFQMTKVLKHFGLTYMDLFHKTKARLLFREKTNVLSYYILKEIINFFCIEFFSWCKKWNGKNYIVFRKSNEALNSFVQFILLSSKSSDFFEAVKCAEESYNENTKDLFILNTMKMTICELG